MAPTDQRGQVTFTSSECTTPAYLSGNTLLQHLQNLIPIQYNTLDSFSRQDLLAKKHSLLSGSF